MENLIKIFDNQSIEIVLDSKKEPLFVVKDICDILELDNTAEAIKGLDENEYTTLVLMRSGQSRNMLVVNESGFYSLIFKSRKPVAKKMRKWVTSEVLPEIRRTGSYGNKELILKTQLLNSEKAKKIEFDKQISELNKQRRNVKSNIEQLEADILRICPPIAQPKQLDLFNQK